MKSMVCTHMPSRITDVMLGRFDTAVMNFSCGLHVTMNCDVYNWSYTIKENGKWKRHMKPVYGEDNVGLQAVDTITTANYSLHNKDFIHME